MHFLSFLDDVGIPQIHQNYLLYSTAKASEKRCTVPVHLSMATAIVSLSMQNCSAYSYSPDYEARPLRKR